MHFAWYVVLCSWVALTSLSLGCEFPDGIIMTSLLETTDPSESLWTSIDITGVASDETRFNISDNGYDYKDAFDVQIDSTSGPEGTFKIIFRPGPKYKDHVDLFPPRSLDSNTLLFYTCDNVEYNRPVVGQWTDQNTRAPEFVALPSNPIFTIATNWDKKIPLNWGQKIQISDKDYSFENTLPINFNTSPDGILRFEFINLPYDPEESREYLSEVQMFIADEYTIESGSVDIDIWVLDGINEQTVPISITLEIESADTSPPKFTQVSYYHKLNTWPKIGDEIPLDPPIFAPPPDDPTANIVYSVGPSSAVQFIDQTDPTKGLIFTEETSPSDGKRVLIVDIIATKEGTALTSSAGLILELPVMPKPIFTSGLIVKNVDWNEGEGISQDIIEENVIIGDPSDIPKFTIESVYPPNLISNIELQETNDNSIHLSIKDITEDLMISNNVVLVRIIAQLGDDEFDRTAAVIMTLYFPEKIVSTTPNMDCPTSVTDDNCPPCVTTTTEDTPPTCEPTFSTSSCEPCSECPDPDPSSGTPVTCPPSTTNSECDCFTSPGSVEPSSCPPCITTTTISDSTDCPTDTTCPPCNEDCNSTSTTPFDPSTFFTCPEQIPCSTTEESCIPCDECSSTSTGPCETCPTDPTCPTAPPPTDCPVTCPTTPPPTDCPVTCPPSPPPTTNCPITTPCPTTPPPTDCPVTCPSTPAPCLTTPPPTECPITCAPPITCSTTTACPSPSTECPDCPTDSSSNTGLVVGIIIVSVLFAGALGAAGYFFWKLKNAATSFPSTFGENNNNPPKSARFSFAQPDQPKLERGSRGDFEEDKGWLNPRFSNAASFTEPSNSAAGLEQVLTHPTPSTSSTAFSPTSTQPIASPYMIAPIVDGPAPIKSSLAKPKEIAPDYEEGLGLNNESSNVGKKPKSVGVKIADEVEIINGNDKTELLDEDERL